MFKGLIEQTSEGGKRGEQAERQTRHETEHRYREYTSGGGRRREEGGGRGRLWQSSVCDRGS